MRNRPCFPVFCHTKPQHNQVEFASSFSEFSVMEDDQQRLVNFDCEKMQKFVVIKKQTQTPALHETNEILPAKVKMSGYLKKKRNKMGGWRKLWFVLQNQLLLSYNSQEEYDRKLVSFKDVLNLVPGTIVRPLGGFRFTIETTSNIIYTFRCDDSKTCTLWITALVESLTMKGKCAKENGVGKSSKFHISLENIKQSQHKKIVRASHSWDSICKSKSVKFARIPIGQTTARILERNGISNTELSRIHSADQIPEEIPPRARNFRLHDKRLSLNQSDEVSRINQMFSRSTTSVNSTSPRSPVNIRGAGTGSCTHASSKDRSIHQLLVQSVNCISLDGVDRHRKCDGRGSARDLNQNKTMDEPHECALEKQVQRLTLKDSSGPNAVPHYMQNGSSVDNPTGCNGDGSPCEEVPPVDGKLYPRLSASSDNLNKAEPIYAVVDLKNKYARRARMRELEEQMERERPKSVHVVTSDYEEVLNFSHEFLDQNEEENENIYEPINIPDNSHQRHAMWKYFPRINIEALIEMTRSRRKEPKVEPPSPFSDIRKKLGNHRKSIKNRMKKLYTKDNIVGLKERNAFSDDELDSQGATGSTSGISDNSIKSSCGNIEKPMASFVFNEIEKYRRGEKQIFGSLSRLKKARTSLCLDDSSGKKKLLVSAKSACFQQELQREITRRSGSKKVVCHSKFYD